MEFYNIRPTPIYMSLLIDRLGNRKDYVALKAQLESGVLKDKNSFDENVYNSLIEAFFKCRKQMEQLEYFWKMQAHVQLLEKPGKTYKTMRDSLLFFGNKSDMDRINDFYRENYPDVI